MSGHVKWFNQKKGWGFIVPSDGSEDVFVHQTSVHAPGFRTLLEGEEVEFSVDYSSGKKSAVGVTGPGGDYVKCAQLQSRSNTEY
eukprot:CAMPEP_0177596810 /NCGR_PEP_ID=MMETSP0419_2-20121207/11341_1 /TAXON_ID=582737 /ORGANISM="Tetraselmis sp., Strain GSL018" /LENGTH=84 /DNA_ID=CAMNT_0019088867 /DNA_START=246 /DNA_END=500 /DNA_ORIENTATION=-